MAKLWQYLFPTYGNYGGPGWSGGARMNNYAEVDWSVQPSDSLDECFHDHDKDYQASIAKFDSGEINDVEKNQMWVKADEALVGRIKEISADPKKWPKPPTKNSTKYAWFYRKGALVGFWCKVKLYSCKYGKVE